MVPSYSTGCLIKMTPWRSSNGCLIQMTAVSGMREQGTIATIITGQSQRTMCVTMYLFQLILDRLCKSLVLIIPRPNKNYHQCFRLTDAADDQPGRQWLPQHSPECFCIRLTCVVPEPQWQWDQWGSPVRPGRQSSVSREPPGRCSIFCCKVKEKPWQQLPHRPQWVAGSETTVVSPYGLLPLQECI